MTHAAEALYQLQQIELEAQQIQQRLAEIKTALGDNAAVQQAEADVHAIEEKLKPLRSKLRDLELETQSNSQKSKASEDRLYSGTVKNPKEMQDIQNEVDALKGRNTQLEEQTLDMMLNIEEVEDQLAQAEQTLAQTVSASEDENSDLVNEQKQLWARFEELKAQHQTAIANIKPEDHKMYETMKPRKGQRPVAVMQGRSCTACGVEQTLEIERAVKRRDSLVKCENCERILVRVN
jgi:uncharacterized protein